MHALIAMLLDLPEPLRQAVEFVESHCYLVKVHKISTHVYHYRFIHTDWSIQAPVIVDRHDFWIRILPQLHSG